MAARLLTLKDRKDKTAEIIRLDPEGLQAEMARQRGRLAVAGLSMEAVREILAVPQAFL